MSSDLQTLFVNLAEKERIKGHHSPEGRTIRTLSRALNGWSAGNLSAGDVLVLCDQAMEDWLKARSGISMWSTPSLAELMAMAVAKDWIAGADAVQLQRLRDARSHMHEQAAGFSNERVEAALKFCIQLVEKHW